MSQIIKVYMSLFMITVFVVLGVSLIGADTGVSNARAYHDSFVKQIEESNMSQTVIDSCKDNAASLGYTVTTNNITDEKNKLIAVEVVTATRTILLEKKQPEDMYDEDNRIYNVHFVTSEGSTYMNLGVKNQEQLVIPVAPPGKYWIYNGTRIGQSDNLIVSTDMNISLSE